MKRIYLILTLFSLPAPAQRIEVRDAAPVTMPAAVDSNSPAFWMNGRLHLLNSTGMGPMLSSGPSQFRLSPAQPVVMARNRPWPAWIEAVWVDPSGTILAWYHQEHEHICGAQRPAQPHIGAAISNDGGRTFLDQGVILSSPYPPDCASKNGYFAGGHGDFSVVLDREQKFFYFVFGNYAGPLREQGVALARMPYEMRFSPAGSVHKYHGGEWSQPGAGGKVTPIFRARASWQAENTDAYWGPSVHWNTYLETYVVLLNRSCCTSGFPQFGIYATFTADLGDPAAWSRPKKILDTDGWYPQVLGLGEGGADSLAGRRARLYVYGRSEWEIVFHRTNSSPVN